MMIMKKKNSIDWPSKAAELKQYSLQPLLHDGKQVQEVGEMLSFLRQDYPDFRYWYNNMVLPGLTYGSRQIYTATDRDSNRLAGAMILKDTPVEKKICTLCVLDEHQRHGIGTRFVELAAQRLCTMTPLITVSSRHLEEFGVFFEQFSSCNRIHFTLGGSYEGYYRDGMTEYTFNGILPTRLKKTMNG